ncbi:unnamed protein product [Rotaria sordida]|uniref:Uncharacterized protein n=2 Tax=Rotaria sordida TaxID=392033 RepID=A0A818Y987_9BILA|nr:unnamed protein product [Rotaria sordida]
MKQKLSRKNIKKIENIVDHNDDQNDELIIVTAQTNFLSMSNSMNDPDSNASILNSINSNETNTDISNATPTLLAQQNSGGRKLTSKVWLYAKKSDDGQEASCLLCDYTCSCQSHSTSTIRQHLIIKHNKLDLILKSSSVLAKVKISEALKNELHQLCYYAIIKDGRPFNDLNKMGIIALINKLCPGYKPPHRNQVVRHLKDLNKHHHDLLKEELKTVYRLSITLDFWSNRKNESFLCITGHWMNNSLDSISKIIDFSCFNERHTAIEIVKVLREKMIDLGIYEKVFCITCDGAQNLVLACELLNDDIFRIWCYAHRLHLVVINALGFWVSDKKKHIDEPGYSSANILTSNTTTSNTTTSYTTTSNATDQEIEQENMDVEWDLELNDDSWNINGVDLIDEIDTYDTINATANTEFSETTYFYDDEIINEQDIIELMNDSWSNVIKDLIDLTQAQKLILQVVKKCRAIAKILKKSSLISRFVRKEQDSMKSKKNISNDCPSRWNSTFNLIDAIIELKHVIIKLFTDKWSLNLRKDQVSKLAKIELTSENWDLLSALHFVLRPFFLATKMMSGKEYATIGLSYYAIHEIKSFCAKEEKCTEQSKTFKRLLVEKLNKYFYSNSEQIHHLQRLAYFDPTSHLCLNDKEKQQNENYIRKLITDDVYPLESSSNDNLTSSSSLSAQIQVKPSVFDEFMAACGQEDIILTGQQIAHFCNYE